MYDQDEVIRNCMLDSVVYLWIYRTVKNAFKISRSVIVSILNSYSTTTSFPLRNKMAGDKKVYEYDPSLAAAIVFLLFFIVTTSFHLYQMIRTKTWYFIAFVIGGFCKSFLTSAFRYSLGNGY